MGLILLYLRHKRDLIVILVSFDNKNWTFLLLYYWTSMIRYLAEPHSLSFRSLSIQYI